MAYIVEKWVDCEWWYEGKGDINYVNRVIPYLVERKMLFRLREVEK